MKEDLLKSVRALRKEIREKIKGEVLSEYEEARRDGKYPWEGMWLTPEQISTVQQQLKKKDKVVLFELIVLFSFVSVLIMPMLFSITVSLVPRQNGEESTKIFKGIVQQSPASPDLKGTTSKSGEDRKINEGKKAGRREFSRVSGDTNKSNGFVENQKGKVSAAGQSSELLKGETLANSGKTVSRKKAGKDNTYFVQVGAWKKMSYARKVAEKLKDRYPGVFIEQRNNMYKVRIPEILGEEQGAAILKEIRENFNFTPLLVKRK